MAENRIENESFEINFIHTEIKKKERIRKASGIWLESEQQKNAKFRYSLTII